MHPRVIVPYTGQLTEAQIIYNNSYTSLRQMIERTIRGAAKECYQVNPFHPGYPG